MTLGLVGKKIGMTQKFFESGEAVPVTVLHVEPGKIVEVIEKDKLEKSKTQYIQHY